MDIRKTCMCDLRLFQPIPMAIYEIDGPFVNDTNVVRLDPDDGTKPLVEVVYTV